MNVILIAVISLGAIALVSAAILYIASKKLKTNMWLPADVSGSGIK